MRKTWLFVCIFLAMGLLAACGAPEAAPANDAVAADQNEMAMTEKDTAANMSDEAHSMPDSGAAMAQDDAAMATDETAMSGEQTMALSAWATLPLVNARTGETFTLADLSGKTLFVEPMATWCTNCRRQLTNVREAQAQLGDNVVFIALSVETNLTPADLAQYADKEGFDWLFAVMSPEILRELSAEFGQTIANPPSTPHFLILPDGSTTDLVTGIEPASDLVQRIQAAEG